MRQGSVKAIRVEGEMGRITSSDRPVVVDCLVLPEFTRVLQSIAI